MQITLLSQKVTESDSDRKLTLEKYIKIKYHCTNPVTEKRCNLAIFQYTVIENLNKMPKNIKMK